MYDWKQQGRLIVLNILSKECLDVNKIDKGNLFDKFRSNKEKKLEWDKIARGGLKKLVI